MKNRVLTVFNIILGWLIGLILPSCNTQKVAKKSQVEPPREMVMENKEVIVLYGIPPEVYKEMQKREQQEAQQNAQDSTATKPVAE